MEEKRIIEICKEFKQIALYMERLHKELKLESHLSINTTSDYANLRIGEYRLLHMDGEFTVRYEPHDIEEWRTVCEL